MGIKEVAGIALLLVSLGVLGYTFYEGSIKGMIGCEKLEAKLLINTSNGLKTCIIPGPLVCNKTAEEAFVSKVSKLKGGAAPGSCNTTGRVKDVEIVKHSVDSPEALMTVLAWIGLIVGPWLAFGETPTAVSVGRKRRR